MDPVVLSAAATEWDAGTKPAKRAETADALCLKGSVVRTGKEAKETAEPTHCIVRLRE